MKSWNFNVLHTVGNLHFLSKKSTLISRENCQFFGGEKLVNVVLDFLAVDNFDFTRKILIWWKTRENVGVWSKLNSWTKMILWHTVQLLESWKGDFKPLWMMMMWNCGLIKSVAKQLLEFLVYPRSNKCLWDIYSNVEIIISLTKWWFNGGFQFSPSLLKIFWRIRQHFFFQRTFRI